MLALGEVEKMSHVWALLNCGAAGLRPPPNNVDPVRFWSGVICGDRVSVLVCSFPLTRGVCLTLQGFSYP